MIELSLRRSAPADVDVPLLAVALDATAKVDGVLSKLDDKLTGALGRAVSDRDFRGGRDEMMYLSGTTKGPRRVLLIGMGKPTDRPLALRRAASIVARQAHKNGAGEVAFFAAAPSERDVEAIAVGLATGAWEYPDLKTPPPEEERRRPLASAQILVDDEKASRDALKNGEALAAGYELSRRLAMMPGNLCTPDFLADTSKDLGKRNGIKVTVWGRSDLEKAKMGSFLCVAQGTDQDPKLVTMEYRKGKGGKPIVLVGKGLCFDTGGISIKPAQSMEYMKFDMCGAAGVIGAMETIARMELPVDVVGIFGATTNMPSGNAVKPGDVVRAQSGKYIEVINTDAEGRLVLADLLSHAKTFDPSAVIDAATLTGAVVIALGHTATGVFGNDDALATEVIAAGQRASEPSWQLPLWDDYKALIKSDVADIKNTGGRPAGSITAAMFLKEFAEGYPWVHLDIAGTAYSESDLTVLPAGPTGVPVGTFVEFVRGRAGKA